MKLETAKAISLLDGMVEIFETARKNDRAMADLGYGNTPFAEIWCGMQDLIHAFIGEPDGDGDTWQSDKILHSVGCPPDRKVSLLLSEYLKNSGAQ